MGTVAKNPPMLLPSLAACHRHRFIDLYDLASVLDAASLQRLQPGPNDESCRKDDVGARSFRCLRQDASSGPPLFDEMPCSRTYRCQDIRVHEVR